MRFLGWILPTLIKLKMPISRPNRRLLAIYDLSSQPFSIGDILIIQEASLILKEKRNIDQIDFAIVFNQRNPAAPDVAFDSITEANVLYHLASVLPAAQINPYLGSLFIFNSHTHFHRFIADNSDYYDIWPSAWDYTNKDYLYYSVFNEIVYDYYQEYRSIPRLPCRQFLIDDACSFYYRHVWPDIPVTVQTRNNPIFGTHRNVHMESWIKFFEDCRGRYPVKFIIVCSHSEIDDRLRQCPNVLIAKDFHTSVEQDLTLIHEAAIHMGSSSGMGTIALFNEKPYLIVNTDMDAKQYRGIIREESFLRFFFASPFQRFSLGKETAELLISEFSRMWSAINVDEWWTAEKMAKNSERKPLTWLR